jgi:hypothetical protein
VFYSPRKSTGLTYLFIFSNIENTIQINALQNETARSEATEATVSYATVCDEDRNGRIVANDEVSAVHFVIVAQKPHTHQRREEEETFVTESDMTQNAVHPKHN